MLLQASADTPGQTGRLGLASCVAKRSCGFSISQDSSGVSLSWLTILYPLPSCWALLGQLTPSLFPRLQSGSLSLLLDLQ